MPVLRGFAAEVCNGASSSGSSSFDLCFAEPYQILAHCTHECNERYATCEIECASEDSEQTSYDVFIEARISCRADTCLYVTRHQIESRETIPGRSAWGDFSTEFGTWEYDQESRLVSHSAVVWNELHGDQESATRLVRFDYAREDRLIVTYHGVGTERWQATYEFDPETGALESPR